MKKESFRYTPEAHETLQYAQLLTFADDKKYISSLSLFWAIYVMVDQHDFSVLFWSLLGVSDVSVLQSYFDAHYGSISLEELPADYSLVHSLMSAMGDDSPQAVDFAKLLYVSVGHATRETQAVLDSLSIDRDTLLKNCHYIIHHPVISQVGLFVFLDILSKLVDKLPLDITKMNIMNINMDMIHNQHDQDVMDHNESSTGSTQSTVTQTKDDKKLTIEYFATDLVHEAKNGDVDPIIGRDKEIDQMIYTLLRKTKNNPLLLGEAGVGKTAAVEGLAQRIASDDVPEKLKDMRIMMLDMTSVVAGTKYRGEFEARMKSILEESVDPTNRIILFIDEIHTMIGAGGQENGDAAQMIKPLLARGKIKLIGATTFDEYQKHIEKDAALKRRFQEVTVDEPDFETAKAILTGLKSSYEEYHGVVLTDDAIESAIRLSTRYILNKHLPDKAIDLIDEASAKTSTLSQKLELNGDYQKIEDEIASIDQAIEKAIASQDYFDAAELKKTQEQLKQKLLEVRKTVALPHHLRPSVDMAAIADVLSSKTGIPADFVQESEHAKLKRLRHDLTSTVLGQEEATDAVVKSLMRSRLSAVERNKPLASFLFLGPSGTGKTHLAKTIARDYFADEKALIRVDMSEFMEKHSVSKLIGSAPGYVGHDEGGLLTEQVRRRPYSVILFDEIEKASKDVLNILLQVLDEGHLKDNKGRWIDFKSTIIIMTSNLGSDEFAKKMSTIGFQSGTVHEADNHDFDRKKERVMDRLKGYLPAELLNRIDHTVVFRPLSKEVMTDIFKKEYATFSSHWAGRDEVSVPKLSAKKIAKIIDEIYDPQLGARPIAKYIHQTIESKMIDEVFEGE